MPELGKKFNCYSCHTKFYDLGKPIPLCPKCGADQRDAEEAPLITPSRSRSRAAAAAAVVPEPVDDDFAAEGETPARPVAEGDEEEEVVPEADREEAEEEESDEEY